MEKLEKLWNWLADHPVILFLMMFVAFITLAILAVDFLEYVAYGK